VWPTGPRKLPEGIGFGFPFLSKLLLGETSCVSPARRWAGGFLFATGPQEADGPLALLAQAQLKMKRRVDVLSRVIKGTFCFVRRGTTLTNQPAVFAAQAKLWVR